MILACGAYCQETGLGQGDVATRFALWSEDVVLVIFFLFVTAVVRPSEKWCPMTEAIHAIMLERVPSSIYRPDGYQPYSIKISTSSTVIPAPSSGGLSSRDISSKLSPLRGLTFSR